MRSSARLYLTPSPRPSATPSTREFATLSTRRFVRPCTRKCARPPSPAMAELLEDLVGGEEPPLLEATTAVPRLQPADRCPDRSPASSAEPSPGSPVRMSPNVSAELSQDKSS